jgi:hypothetical protein
MTRRDRQAVVDTLLIVAALVLLGLLGLLRDHP